MHKIDVSNEQKSSIVSNRERQIFVHIYCISQLKIVCHYYDLDMLWKFLLITAVFRHFFPYKHARAEKKEL